MAGVAVRSFKISVFLFKIFGIWPSTNKFYQIYSITFYFIFIFSYSLSTVLYMIANRLKGMVLLINICTTVEFSALVVKATSLVLNKNKLRNCIMMLDSEKLNMKGPYEEMQIKKGSLAVNRLIACYLLSVVIIWPVFGVSFIFEKERRFMTPLWLPYDAFKTDLRYWTTSAWVILGTAIQAYSNAVIDTTVAGTMKHLSVQIKILKNSLHNLDKGLGNFDSKATDEKVFERIRNCINHYVAIEKYSCQIEDVFGVVTFIELFCSAVVLSDGILIVTFSDLETLKSLYIFLIGFIPLVCAELIMYCWYADEAFQESLSINTSLYTGNWYKFGPKSKRALIIFMERAKRPLCIRAGGYITLSLNTLLNIFQKSYTLFTLLRQINQ